LQSCDGICSIIFAHVFELTVAELALYLRLFIEQNGVEWKWLQSWRAGIWVETKPRSSKLIPILMK
jgi:hypothetical protein